MVDVSVPTAPALSAVRNVELIHTGRWAVSSGNWNASREDLLAAVAALDCPAVRRPVLKLGHSHGGQPLWAGNPTGQPAVGWVDNLRLLNQGHTLVGDFAGMPGWLGDVAASAYPDRSVEGSYDFRCQIGHTHPFVVTAVALLGVTAPGVGTLRSLQDVGTLYGVDAGAGTQVVARFAPDQPRAPEGSPIGGQWIDTDAVVSPVLDKLKLAGRIRLGEGERLAGSDRVAGRRGPNDVVMALTHSGEGPQLRLGVVNEGDARKWSAGNRGATAVLGPDGMARLQQAMTEATTAGQKHRRDYNEQADALDAEAERLQQREIELLQMTIGPPAPGGSREAIPLPPELRTELDQVRQRLAVLDDEYPDADDEIASGVIEGTRWGDLVWRVSGVDDTEGGWDVELVVRPADAAADWSMSQATGEEREARFQPAELRKFQTKLRGLLGLVGAQAGSAPAQVEAAADVTTGAMVALIPADGELSRLAADGGEQPDHLHVTLFYLGDAADWPQAAREALVAEMRDAAEVIPPGEADGFAVAAFNPHHPDRDTAVVLELGGDGLEDVHGLVEAAVGQVAEESGVQVPQQHTPFRPHVTLAYTDDLTRVVELADRTGPVRFDRLRVAFAGENVDIPLAGEGSDLSDADVDGLTDDDMPAVDESGQVVAQQSRRVTRSDAPLRRYWLRGKGAAKIRWNTPGDWTRCVRQLRRHVRDPKGLCAVYHRQATGVWPGDRRNVGRHASVPQEEAIALPNPNPTIVHAAAQVSVDDVRTAYYRQAPQQAWIREFHTSPQRLIVANDADGSVARVDFEVGDDGAISFSSPVPVRVEYVEQGAAEPAASRMVYASRAESRPDVAAPTQVQAAEVSNKPWEQFTEADFTVEQLRRSALIVRGDGSTKEQMSLPVREPDGTLNRNAVHAAAGGHGVSAVGNISEQERRSAAQKLVRLYREELDETPPDSLLELAGMSTSAAALTTDPQTPAAEPGNPTHEEEIMPLSTEVYQRLGLAEDADADAVNAAVMAALDKADQQPDPTQVAAAAAAEEENKQLTKQVQLLDQQVKDLSAQVSAAAAEKATQEKTAVLDTAQAAGKFAPADRERWEKDYDEAPEVVTRVLASIADGTAVPTTVHGSVGNPQGVADADLPDEPDWLFGPANSEPALAGKE